MTSSRLLLLPISALFLGACGDAEAPDGPAGAAAGPPGGASGSGAGGAGATAGQGGTSNSAGATSGGAVGGPDLTAPKAVLTKTPADGQSDGLPSVFSLGCDEALCTYSCSLDGGAFEDCGPNVSFDGLKPGAHSLKVRAQDAAGNVATEPTEHRWALVFGWRRVGRSESASCGISGERNLYCWGSDPQGELGDGPGVTAPTPVPTLIDGSGDWVDLFDGPASLCGRRASGPLLCWGSAGPLGDPEYGVVAVPTALPGQLVSISSSYSHSCGLDATGALYCLGSGRGELGDGNLTEHFLTTPTRVGTESFLAVAIGDEVSYAVRSDGALFYWGTPQDGPETGSPTRVGAAMDWASVSAYGQHVCAVNRGGQLFCWGRNSEGQLGLGDLANRSVPTQVGTASDWSAVKTVEGGACATKRDGEVYCWGSNSFGELGAPSASVLGPALSPVRAAVSARQLSGADNALCVITLDGFLSCWGSNSSSELGRGVSAYENTAIDLGGMFSQLDMRSDYGGCGLSQGALLCWGSGGHLGQADQTPRAVPTRVGTSSGWTDIDVSAFGADGLVASSACGIRAGQLLCWGANSYGQLGLGTTTAVTEPTPVVVPGVTSWIDVSVGGRAACAISSANQLYCWGENPYGELGLGHTLTTTVPTQVVGSGWTKVSMGYYRTAALRADGTFWSWGVNSTKSPSQLPGNDWVKGAVTGNAECGIRSNGALYCTLQGVSGLFQAGAGTNFVSVVESGYTEGCALDATGALQCFSPNGNFTGLVAVDSPLAGAGWTAFAGQPSGDYCALRATGTRHCRGLRRFGSLGDGVDERIPTRVISPAQ